MKKIMMVAIALMTLTAIAQDKEHRKGAFKDLSAEEIATLKTKKMTLHLDLTESQQAKVKALVLEEAKYNESRKAARKDKKTDDDNTKKPTKEERYAMVNAQLDRKIEMKKQMKSILNAEQYEKWETSLKKRSKNKQQKRRDHKSDKN